MTTCKLLCSYIAYEIRCVTDGPDSRYAITARIQMEIDGWKDVLLSVAPIYAVMNI